MPRLSKATAMRDMEKAIDANNVISAVQNVAQQAVDVAAPVVLSAGLIAAGSAGGALIGFEIAVPL